MYSSNDLYAGSHQFIQTQLNPTQQASFLLIGEDHIHSSSLVGLAHCLHAAKLSGKQIIIISEALQRLQGLLGKEKSYSIKELDKVMKKHDADYLPLVFFIKSGVKVYGLENDKTLPIDALKGKTKTEILAEAQKSLPYLFENKDGTINQKFVDAMITKSKSDDVNVGEFKYNLNFRYSLSEPRLTVVNDEIVKQMLLLEKKYQGNSLIIFAGGSAHIPNAFYKDKTVIDAGLLKRLQDIVGKDNVHACFFTSEKSDENIYTPRPDDGGFHYGSIPNRLLAPSRFELADGAKSAATATQSAKGLAQNSFLKKPIKESVPQEIKEGKSLKK